MREPSPRGIERALNAACKMAEGEWLFIVNDDMVFSKEWREAVGRFLVSGRMLACNVIEPQLPGRRPNHHFHAENLGLDHENFDFEALDSYVAKQASEELGTGTHYPFFIERKLFEAVGGADTVFSGPCHDPDLFYRLILAGAEPLRMKMPVLYHFSGVSLRFGEKPPTRNRMSVRWMRAESESRVTFIKKWGVKPNVLGSRTTPHPTIVKPWAERPHSFLESAKYGVLVAQETLRLHWRVLYQRFILLF
jgi:GT2 family glycosyltransferase